MWHYHFVIYEVGRRGELVRKHNMSSCYLKKNKCKQLINVHSSIKGIPKCQNIFMYYNTSQQSLKNVYNHFSARKNKVEFCFLKFLFMCFEASWPPFFFAVFLNSLVPVFFNISNACDITCE